MRWQLKFLAALLVLGSAAMLGCSSAPGKKHAATKGHAPSVPWQEPIPPPGPVLLTPEEVEQRAEALARFATGLTYQLNDEPDHALDEYFRAAMADAGNDALVADVAHQLLRAKKGAQAIELLKKATTLPDASGTLDALLGVAYAQAGKRELAIAADRAAIRKMPRLIQAYGNLTQVYLQMGQPKDALKVLEEAARQPSPDGPYLIDLAEIFLIYMRSQPNEADALKPRIVTMLDEAGKQTGDNVLMLQKMGDFYRSAGNFAKAAECYVKLLSRFPNNPAAQGFVREQLTGIYRQSGDWTHAAEQLEAILKDVPDNSQAYYVLAGVLAEDKKYDKAADNYERAIQLNPGYDLAYYQLAEVRINQGKGEDALKVLERARAKFRQSFILEYFSALAYGKLEKYSDAIRHLTAAEVVARANNESQRLTYGFYFELAAMYERNKDYDRAEQFFRKTLQMQPTFAEALNYLGYMWADQGVKLDEARKFIEQAVKQEPDNAAFLDSLGWVYFKLGQHAKALEWQLKAVKNSKKDDATLQDHLGDIHAALKHYREAREAWRKSLSIEPNPGIEKKLQAPPGEDSSP